MSATYELWLTDDSGKRILLLNQTGYFSYSRVINGFGTFQVGLPFRQFREQVWPIFAPDRRVEVWRSAASGVLPRLEGSFFLREPKIYTRVEDNIDMIEFFGRSPLDLLNRRWIIQAAGTSYAAKTAAIDDMMKAIVREQMLYGAARDKDGNVDYSRAFPSGEFSVQADLALGPVISRRFADRNVLDVLKELKDTSFQKYEDNPTTNRKIYFDVVASGVVSTTIFYILGEASGEQILDEAGNPLLGEASVVSAQAVAGFEFQTFADLRGVDRTDKLVFSIANSNLKSPFYSKSHFEERNSIIVKGSGLGESRAVTVVNDTARINASRWNRYEEMFEANYEVQDSELDTVGAAQLKVGQPKEELIATFLNTQGSEDTPRSLYGVDWDLGDLVSVWYADQLFTCEIVVVYVGMDENGIETITGRNTIEGIE